MRRSILPGFGILTAITASLCCITPLLAVIAGTSGLAASFTWLDPARPYLVGLTILVLGFAWYQKLRPSAKEIDCECEADEKPKFMQTKAFLGMVTVFAILMLALPYYADTFYPETEKQIEIMNKSDIQKVELSINGMTCSGCENTVSREVNKLNGIIKVYASHEKASAFVEFDKSVTTIAKIEEAIRATGYTVNGIKEE